MNVAICGYPPLINRVQDYLKNSDFKIKFFIEHGEDKPCINLPTINFFEFKWLFNAGELDGVIIADKSHSPLVKSVVQQCKLYKISKVIIADFINFNPFYPLYMLDPNKIYIGYLEANLVDGCNLNCKGCTHFSSLFTHSEIYSLENFQRDISRLAKICDVGRLRLLGGEPLLLKNLDEYIEITRKYFPKSNLRLVTNGLLIPSISQKILDAIRENNVVIDISSYAPTLKIADKIKNVLTTNKITFNVNFNSYTTDKFLVYLTLHAENNPDKARKFCLNDACRFLRDGKIYKCPLDALKFKLTEKFGIENYPEATSIDINSPNFSSLLQMLDGNVEMCYWCSEKVRSISWQPTSNPKLEDWLADPSELKNFLMDMLVYNLRGV